MQIYVEKFYSACQFQSENAACEVVLPYVDERQTDWLQIAPMISFLLELLLPMCHYPSPCLCLAPLPWRRRLVSSDAEHSRHSDERKQL